jgi:hypothetical protein
VNRGGRSGPGALFREHRMRDKWRTRSWLEWALALLISTSDRVMLGRPALVASFAKAENSTPAQVEQESAAKVKIPPVPAKNARDKDGAAS